MSAAELDMKQVWQRTQGVRPRGAGKGTGGRGARWPGSITWQDTRAAAAADALAADGGIDRFTRAHGRLLHLDLVGPLETLHPKCGAPITVMRRPRPSKSQRDSFGSASLPDGAGIPAFQAQRSKETHSVVRLKLRWRLDRDDTRTAGLAGWRRGVDRTLGLAARGPSVQVPPSRRGRPGRGRRRGSARRSARSGSR